MLVKITLKEFARMETVGDLLESMGIEVEATGDHEDVLDVSLHSDMGRKMWDVFAAAGNLIDHLHVKAPGLTANEQYPQQVRTILEIAYDQCWMILDEG